MKFPLDNNLHNFLQSPSLSKLSYSMRNSSHHRIGDIVIRLVDRIDNRKPLKFLEPFSLALAKRLTNTIFPEREAAVPPTLFQLLQSSIRLGIRRANGERVDGGLPNTSRTPFIRMNIDQLAKVRNQDVLVLNVGGTSVKAVQFAVAGGRLTNEMPGGKPASVDVTEVQREGAKTPDQLADLIWEKIKDKLPQGDKGAVKTLVAVIGVPGDNTELEDQQGIGMILTTESKKWQPVGEVGPALLGKFRSEGYTNIEKIAVMNDTVAVAAYLDQEKPTAGMGIVLGGGFNIALVYNGVIYNLEIGRASDYPEDNLMKRMREMKYITTESASRIEYLISGGYQMKRHAAAMSILADQGCCSAKIVEQLSERAVDGSAEFLSDLASGKTNRISLEKTLGVSIKRSEYALMKQMALRTIEQAVDFASTTIAAVVAVVEQLPSALGDDQTLIPAIGSVIWNEDVAGNRKFYQMVQEKVKQITERTVNFVETTEYEGAAIAGISL